MATYSLPQMAYGKILAAVIDDRYPVNSRLPSELALSTELGISRPILRAALARLKDDGIIASRRGSGNYVIRQPHQSVLQFAPATDMGDVQDSFKYRIGVEGEAAYYAALNYTDADRQALKTALAALSEAARKREVGVDEDFDFHLRIAEATGNPYFVAALKAVREQTSVAMRIARHLSLHRTTARMKQVEIEHEAIYDRIVLRHADDARQAMRTHLEAARRRLFESDLVDDSSKP